MLLSGFDCLGFESGDSNAVQRRFGPKRLGSPGHEAYHWGFLIGDYLIEFFIFFLSTKL